MGAHAFGNAFFMFKTPVNPVFSISGRRLNAILVLLSVALADAVVSLVSWLVLGALLPSTLLISTLSACIIATLIVTLAAKLRARLSHQRQRLLELGIQNAQHSLDVAMEAAHMVFWELDLGSGRLDFDPAKRHWLGLPTHAPANALSQWLALVHPDDQPGLQTQYQATLEADAGDLDCEYRVQQTSGDWGWVRTRGRVRDRDAQGRPAVAVGITVHIDARKQAEVDAVRLTACLQDQNQLLNALLEAIPVPVFYKDRDGKYLGFNGAYEAFFGCKRSELIGKSVFDIAPHELATVYHAHDTALMAQPGTQVYESQVQDAAGQLHDVVFHKAAFTDSKGAVSGLIGGLIDITERKQAALALLQSEQRAHSLYALLRRVADNVPDMIWAKDLDKRYLFANKALCDQLLQAQSTDEPVGRDDLFFAQRERALHPHEPHWHTFGEKCQDSDVVTLQRQCACRFDEFGNVRGKPLYLDVHKAPLLDPIGTVIGVVGSARDVTVDRQVQEKLRVAAMVLQQCSEALMLTDDDNLVLSVNPAFTRITGYEPEDVIGRDGKLLRASPQDEHFYQAKWQLIETTGHWQGEAWCQRKDGTPFAVWLTVSTLYHDDGSVHCRAAMFSDITDKKRADELIWTQANFDALTGLPNRCMFQDRLDQDLKKAHRDKSLLVLMFLDLDSFKQVNDRLGHDQGDKLLIEAARRIKACARASDTVARIGGDEFTVILPDLSNVRGVERFASELLEALRQPFKLTSTQAEVSASIGIAVYPQDGRDRPQLLQHADQAMYSAKAAGRHCFRYYQSQHQAG